MIFAVLSKNENFFHVSSVKKKVNVTSHETFISV